MYLEIPCPLVKTDRFVHVNLLLGTGNRFQHKSFRYELKQWNCTKISFTSSIVCWWTRKTFWVNTSSFFKYVELFTPIETNGITLGKLLWLETCCFLYVLVFFVVVVVARARSVVLPRKTILDMRRFLEKPTIWWKRTTKTTSAGTQREAH